MLQLICSCVIPFEQNKTTIKMDESWVLCYDDSYSYVTLAQFSPLKQNQVRHWQNISSCQEPCLKPVCDAVCWWLARSFPRSIPSWSCQDSIVSPGLKASQPSRDPPASNWLRSVWTHIQVESQHSVASEKWRDFNFLLFFRVCALKWLYSGQPTVVMCVPS